MKKLFPILVPAFLCLLFMGIYSCQRTGSVLISDDEKTSPKLFTLMEPEQTNIHFQNTLKEGLNTNVLMYEYLYNGGGVAVGDFNGDDMIDIYLTSNMGDNKFYINKGNMEFQDATATSKASGRSGPWKTGVTAVDINGDNKLDLYVCYSGALPEHKRTNQLFINQGNNANNIPVFAEKAAEYGLASAAFSNQAYFFDYDHDGDLDALLLNHNPKSLAVLNEVSTAEFLKKDDPLQGVRLFNQTNGFFNDVTQASGISGSALTYGLGLGISDLNNDGWVDFYVSNDYTIPDYLYMNNGDGTFTNKLKESMGHNSHFSMGNDIADINNDGWQDIITLDMLPEDNERQKLLLAPDNYEKFDLNIRSGFHYQYMRNMLQLNNGNGTFSEIGQLAGMSNTDWSWAALLADYDNDGWKDLFVTNGYYRDYTNLDFINYMDDYVKSKGRLKREDVLNIIKEMPSSNLVNYAFSNNNGAKFSNKTEAWGLDQPANSNGASYADLDNDGDLDLIVNNINKPAFIYRNESQKTGGNYLQIKLQGAEKNTHGIGSKVTLFSNGNRQSVEQSVSKGYLSTISPILHFGLGTNTMIDSLRIKWNNGKTQQLIDVNANQLVTLNEKDALAPNIPIEKGSTLFKEIPSPIKYKNDAANINDFKRQSLLIHQLSNSGPCMVKGDINKDGLEDIFIGGAKGQSAALFIQQTNNQFKRQAITSFIDNKAFEDADAVIFDANGDGYPDIYVASGGYHNLEEKDALLQDRLYIGDGSGDFSIKSGALPQMRVSKSTVAVHDVNNDGHPDLFVGGRVIPGRYPETPTSYLLINDGTGKFTDNIDSIAPELKEMGMITDAEWVDINNDQIKDLIVVGEWMPVSTFIMAQGTLNNETSSYFDKAYNGWWNTIEIADMNNDGQPDLIVGNMGTNTQFKVSDQEPAEMYFDDFDENGSVDPIFCYYIQGESYPYLTRDELLGQLANLHSRFNSYKSYANATISDIFSKEKLNDATKLIANHMKTTVFLSTDQSEYKVSSLPIEVQYSPIHSIAVSDYNKDGNTDVLLFGNHHDYKLRLGKFDANYGMLLTGDGTGGFKYINQPISGLDVRGAVKSAITINNMLLLGINQEEVKAYELFN